MNTRKRLRWEKIFNIEIFILFFAIMLFLFRFSLQSGYSMYSTYTKGKGIIFVNLLEYKVKDVEYGDIVVFYSKEEKNYICKRIIGLPGDTISFYDGRVYLNGMILNESDYLDYTKRYTKTYSIKDSFVVPENHVFVLGDNRTNSKDSRFFDNPYISQKDIVGKAIGYIPLFNIGINDKLSEMLVEE